LLILIAPSVPTPDWVSAVTPTSLPLLLRAAPLTFVFLWSTGWISARAAAPYADALTFLTVRFTLAAVALAIFAVLWRASWPASRAEWMHAFVAGILIHAVYLGGVWWAVGHGVPAGISGVIAASQPILTAMLAPLLVNERIASRQWLGIVIGFLGILLVLQPKLAALEPTELQPILFALAINGIGMISVTLGTFYQKRFLATADLRTSTCVQYIAAAATTLPIAYLTEPMRLEWNLQVAVTMAWSVFALSICSVALLFLLIRNGAVSRAATLIYLVPPMVAVIAWALFGERLVALQILGMAVTAAGVALAVRR
jgi:drug/metabolite transporter (DMT)-like permease